MVYAYATSTHFYLINTASEPESPFAPIIINIHLGPSVRVRSRKDEPDIWFKGILMSGMYKAQGQSSKEMSACIADRKTEDEKVTN